MGSVQWRVCDESVCGGECVMGSVMGVCDECVVGSV